MYDSYSVNINDTNGHAYLRSESIDKEQIWMEIETKDIVTTIIYNIQLRCFVKVRSMMNIINTTINKNRVIGNMKH